MSVRTAWWDRALISTNAGSAGLRQLYQPTAATDYFLALSSNQALRPSPSSPHSRISAIDELVFEVSDRALTHRCRRTRDVADQTCAATIRPRPPRTRKPSLRRAK